MCIRDRNMDCGPEGTMIVSSAGGLLIDFEKSAELVPFAGEAVSLAVRGLLGGHSAMMIDQEMGCLLYTSRCV